MDNATLPTSLGAETQKWRWLVAYLVPERRRHGHWFLRSVTEK